MEDEAAAAAAARAFPTSVRNTFVVCGGCQALI